MGGKAAVRRTSEEDENTHIVVLLMKAVGSVPEIKLDP